MNENKLDFLNSKKPLLDVYLIDLIDKEKQLFSKHKNSKLAFEYFKKFVIAGKSVRGALFLEFISILMPNEDIKKYLPIAAAIEIIHSTLLIQDDYMDQDLERRGMRALHSTLYNSSEDDGFRKPSVYSPSAIMCIADVYFFLAFRELSKIENDKVQAVFDYVYKEYSHVGFAQWQDVSFGQNADAEYSYQDIDLVYKYKTARYTFVAPIEIAMILSGTSSDSTKKIDGIAEIIGMVFQIRDDYLNIFGNTAVTGKSIGSDITENKKTFYQYYFFEALKTSDKYQELRDLFGKEVTKDQVQQIQKAMADLGVVDKLDKKIQKYQDDFEDRLKNIDNCINSKICELLRIIFMYVKQRNK